MSDQGTTDRLRFDGRVAVVTGAGQGLGRSYALEYARRGARVVVNDLGGNAHGDGASLSVAQQVVDEIRAAGGEAVASVDSVEQGERVIACAMDHFGRVDVLVNNAGILRDVSFAKMTADDWDAIYRVHLFGSYAVTRAAWPHMREARYGRILMTTSIAGIYGNYGQANYSAAKMGLIGLAQTLALEGAARDIRVNALAPTAASRLTATVMPADMLEVLRPEYVAPAAILLTHESAPVTGKLFEVGGGCVCQVRWEQTQGAFFDHLFTAEDLLADWEKVTSFENARHATRVEEAKTGVDERLGRPFVLTPQK